MQILEILVVGNQKKLFTDFSAHLPLNPVEQPDIETYRLEIDDDLALVFYCIFEDVARSVNFLENVMPHLSRVIWLLEDDSFEGLTLPEKLQELLKKYDQFIPSSIVLTGQRPQISPVAEDVWSHGFYLDRESQLFFWNPGNTESARRIWKLMWEIKENDNN